MHLAHDYIHPYRGPGGEHSMCRVRIYFPEEKHAAPVVIYSEMSTNRGTSITNAAEIIAASVMSVHELRKPLLFIEHYPPETTGGMPESFELVLFDSYEVRRHRVPYGGDEAITIGVPTWRKELDRLSVEIVVGHQV